MKKSVYVIGAGASCEFGFPAGEGLMKNISGLADIRFDHPRQISGDSLLTAAMNDVARAEKRDSNQIRHAFIKVRDGMSMAPSIDNFLDSHRGDSDVELCGKLSIARAILQSESHSPLKLSRNQHRLAYENLQSTWLLKFARALTARCDAAALSARLLQVALIVFNYDRSVEHFLSHFISDYYSISLARAQELVAGMEIYHPYGTTGRLNSMRGDGGVHEFGETPNSAALIQIARGLRTFTQADRADNVDRIRELLTGPETQRIVFLGFGFLPMNVELLLPGRSPTAGPLRVFGSAFGMSQPNRDHTVSALSDRLNIAPEFVRLENLTAAATLDWFSLPLAFD